jgi:hypothetical protein
MDKEFFGLPGHAFSKITSTDSTNSADEDK